MEVVVSVSTFVDQLDVIAKRVEEGGLGAEGKAARKLLEKRGLDEKVVAEARELLTQIGTLEEASDEPEASQVTGEAEDKLWNWYLEWSGIARVAIRDRRLLRSLGFLRIVKNGAAEEEEVVTDEELVTPPPTGTDPVVG